MPRNLGGKSVNCEAVRVIRVSRRLINEIASFDNFSNIEKKHRKNGNKTP
jgi:hypothetical protein